MQMVDNSLKNVTIARVDLDTRRSEHTARSRPMTEVRRFGGESSLQECREALVSEESRDGEEDAQERVGKRWCQRSTAVHQPNYLL